MELPKKKAPGEKLLDKLSLKTKWLLHGGGGLALTGFGLCLFSEAGHIKHTGVDTASWVFMGTLSLVVFNAGLAIFGQAIVYKSQLDYKKKMKEMRKNQPKKRGKQGSFNRKTWKDFEGPLP